MKEYLKFATKLPAEWGMSENSDNPDYPCTGQYWIWVIYVVDISEVYGNLKSIVTSWGDSRERRWWRKS